MCMRATQSGGGMTNSLLAASGSAWIISSSVPLTGEM